MNPLPPPAESDGRSEDELREEALRRISLGLTLPADLVRHYGPLPYGLPLEDTKPRNPAMNTLRKLTQRQLEGGPDAFFSASTVRFSSSATGSNTLFRCPVQVTMGALLRPPRFERLRTRLPLLRTPTPRLDQFTVTVSLYTPVHEGISTRQRLGHLTGAREVTMELWEPVPHVFDNEPRWMYVCVPKITRCQWEMQDVQVDPGGMSFTLLQGNTRGERDTGRNTAHYLMQLTDKGPK